MFKFTIVFILLLTFNLFSVDLPDVEDSYDYKTLVNNLYLTYIDVFKCTKIGLRKSIEGYEVNEKNLLAKQFTNKGMYNELFLGAYLIQYGVFNFLYNNNEKVLNKIVLLCIGFAEIKAIQGWNNPTIGLNQDARFEIHFEM